MFSLDSLFGAARPVLSVIGMAKNTGKTVTLNYLQANLHQRRLCLGLTSVGRDGEKSDVLTRLPKPSIIVQPGTVLATASELVNGRRGWETLENTGISTPLGEVKIFKAKNISPVILAGPSKNKEVGQIIELLRNWGAECILLDGAFDRQSAADPRITSHVILASGASLSPAIDEVVSITKARVEQLSIPVHQERAFLNRVRKSKAKVLLQGEDGLQEFFVPTPLLSKAEWLRLLADGSKFLITIGAVGEGLCEALLKLEKPPTVIVQDGGKIFATPGMWKRLKEKGISFQAEYPINLIGVSVNPTVPGGQGFDPDDLLKRMGSALWPLDTLDVVREKKYKT
ncbi:MAG TPA: hypothetical protein VNU93_01705 [Verrucomicrobiae bacterium]|nr:hypothetical protein [Verrucomicrobiae bacterium]